MGQIIHPGIMFGLFRNYHQDTFTAEEIPLFYSGVDDDIAELLQYMSDEVQQVKTALQQQLGPDVDFSSVLQLADWLIKSYNDLIEIRHTLAQAFRSNRAYNGLKVPVCKIGEDRFIPDFQQPLSD